MPTDEDNSGFGQDQDEGSTPSEHPQRIFRHRFRSRPPAPAISDLDTARSITEHVERYLGPIQAVFRDPSPDHVHIDIHWVPPNNERPFHTLFTTGMSDRPMTSPEDGDEPPYLELTVTLPPYWPIEELVGSGRLTLDEESEHETSFWPIRRLRKLARIPHEYETWFDSGHSIPNGDPPIPLAKGTKMCGWVLGRPMTTPEDFDRLAIPDHKEIQFLAAYPVYREEMQYKLRQGSEALFRKLEVAGYSEVIELDRKSVCKRAIWLF